MKVVVLATDSASTWMLVNELQLDYPELKVVLELPVSRWVLLKRRVAKMGAWTVFGQIAFMLCLPFFRLLTRRHIQIMIDEAGLNAQRPSNLLVTRFDTVNSDQFIAWLVTERPDVVVLNGTRIVSNAVLGACKAIFLNTHCGITPAYRGVHGGYWALFKKDAKNAGVTIHLVDSGIDTGDIVYQAIISIDEKDNFLTYPVKQYIAGLPLMRTALSNVSNNCLITVGRKDLPSAIWHHPTIWSYLITRWFRGVR